MVQKQSIQIDELFSRFLKKLRTDNHALVTQRRESIIQRLNKDFRNLDSKRYYFEYIGSYGRGTAIKGFSDVDLLYKLPSDLYKQYNTYKNNGQSALLQKVKNSLLNTYPQTDIRGDGQVVVIEFSDNMKFEILPVFDIDQKLYVHPDSNDGGSWQHCNPIAEIEMLNYINNKYSIKAKDLIRIAKKWKYYNNVEIKSILLETLAVNFIKQWEYNDKSILWYDWMVGDFFKFLSEQDSKKEYWQIFGSNRRVYKTGNFQNKAKEASAKVSEALINDSIEIWPEIFGNEFEV